MVGIRFRLCEHLVPCVRPSNPDQEVVLLRDIACDLPLTFAPVLSSNEYVDVAD